MPWLCKFLPLQTLQYSYINQSKTIVAVELTHIFEVDLNDFIQIPLVLADRRSRKVQNTLQSIIEVAVEFIDQSVVNNDGQADHCPFNFRVAH
jgi:hypothetical protein